jgi:hypothetical protein
MDLPDEPNILTAVFTGGYLFTTIHKIMTDGEPVLSLRCEKHNPIGHPNMMKLTLIGKNPGNKPLWIRGLEIKSPPEVCFTNGEKIMVENWFLEPGCYFSKEISSIIWPDKYSNRATEIVISLDIEPKRFMMPKRNAVIKQIAT